MTEHRIFNRLIVILISQSLQVNKNYTNYFIGGYITSSPIAATLSSQITSTSKLLQE